MNYKYKKLEKNFKLVKFDTISKFNLLNFNNLLKFDSLKIIIFLNTFNINFLKYIYIISKIFKEIYDQKIYIFKIQKLFLRGKYNKNNLTYYVGINVSKFFLFKHLDYLYNFIIPYSKKFDNKIIYRKSYNHIMIKFFNLNYLLGWEHSFFNIILNFNYILKFNKKFIFHKFITNFYNFFFTNI